MSHRICATMQPPYEGIVLDDTYSEGLLRAYLEEGYISPREDPNPFVAERITRRVNGISRSVMKEESLMLLALFDKVYLYFRNIDDMFDLEPLAERGLAWPLGLHAGESSAWSKDNFRALRAKGTIVADNFRVENSPKARLSDCNMTDLFGVQDVEDLDFLSGLLLSRVRSHALVEAWEEDAPQLIRALASDPDFISFLSKKPARSSGHTKKSMTLLLRQLLLDIREELADSRSLLRHSADLAVPAAWYTPVPVPNRTRSLPSDTRDNYWVAVQTLLREVKSLPNPGTATEALSLRDSKSMRELRSMLRTWVESARAGDRSVEAEVRRGIEQATKSLRLAGRCKQVAGILTYLAVPIAVMELLLISAPVASLPLAIIGGAAQASADVTEWRHRWLLWRA